MKFQGIILAGGKSTRFGTDKAMALVGGISMIQQAVHLLNELELEPCIITSASRDYSFLNCWIERDLVLDKGPLGGLYTACCLFKDSSLVVLTCDMPRLSSAAVRYLIASHQRKNQATVYTLKGSRWQPFPGVYEASLGNLIKKVMEKKQLSLQQLFEVIPTAKAIPFRFNDELLANINERKDMSAL